MNTFIVYTFSSYMTPKIQTKEIMGNDMLSALQNAQGAGVNTSEIICVKLKMVAETVAGL